MTREICAFIKRDILIQWSYRLNFILMCFNVFGSILIFYFISKLFEKQASAYLSDYPGGYFPFVFIGLALSGCLVMLLGALSRNIRIEQMIGTLEAVLATPVRIYAMVIAFSLWYFAFASLSILTYLAFGVCFFKIHLANVNLPAAAVIFFLTAASFSSIGILSASSIIVFKRGDPVGWAIGIFSSFFGGAYFPLEVLPKYFGQISKLFPLTYALRSLRLALLKGYGFAELMPDITVLLAFSASLFPLSLLIFKYAVKRAKIDGSLTQY